MALVAKAAAFDGLIILVTVQGAVLTSDEFPAIIFIHRVGADGAVRFALCGYVCDNICSSAKATLQRRITRPTPIVLLLLMVVAQFTLTLRGHTALGLQHLLCFIWPCLVSLICVEVLEVRTRMRPDLIEIADRVVSLCHSAHTRVYDTVVRQPEYIRIELCHTNRNRRKLVDLPSRALSLVSKVD